MAAIKKLHVAEGAIAGEFVLRWFAVWNSIQLCARLEKFLEKAYGVLQVALKNAKTAVNLSTV